MKEVTHSNTDMYTMKLSKILENIYTIIHNVSQKYRFKFFLTCAINIKMSFCQWLFCVNSAGVTLDWCISKDDIWYLP